MSNRILGYVQKWNAAEGTGVLISKAHDIVASVHFAAIAARYPKELIPGESVEFSVIRGQEEYIAVDVVPLSSEGGYHA